MIEIFASPWLPPLCLLALGIGARFVQGSWLAPSAFPAFLWAVYLIIPLALLPDAIFPSALWVIVGLVVSAQLGAMLTEQPGIAGTNQLCDESAQTDFTSHILRVSLLWAAVATAGSTYFALSSLRLYQLPFSLDGFLKLGGIFYALADQGEFEPAIVRGLLFWTFPAALLGGMAACLAQSRWKKALSVSFLLPASLFAVTVAMRLGTFIACCCWVGGYLAMKSYLSRGRYRVQRKTLLVVGLVALVVASYYVGLQNVRSSTYPGLNDLSAMLAANFFGYLPAFGSWWNNRPPHDLTLGHYTLAGAFDFLGLSTRERGLYVDAVVLQSGIGTNIFSAFRGLIEDFSLPGALFLSMFFGMLAGRAYSALSQGRLQGSLILAGYYAFLIWSPVVSIFNYNGVIAAWLLGAIVISRRARALRLDIVS